MNKPVLLASFAMLSLGLAGCGGLVPPQSVENPLGLALKSGTMTFGPATQAVLRPQAALNGSVTFSGSFDDVSALPVTPTKLDVSLTVGNITGAGSLPASLTISNLHISGSVSDAANTLPLDYAVTPASITLTKGAGNTYTAAPDTVGFTVPSTDMAKLNTILTTGGSNTSTVTISGTADPAVAGDSLTIEIVSSSGTVSF